MKRLVLIGIASLSSALFIPTQGGASAKYALWILVSDRNEAATVDTSVLRAIYTGRRQYWEDNVPVVPMNTPPRSRSRVYFDQVVLNMSPEEAGRFWVDQQIRGHARRPRKVPSLRLASAMLRKIRGAIAYTEASDCIPRGTKVVGMLSDSELVSPLQREIPTCQ